MSAVILFTVLIAGAQALNMCTKTVHFKGLKKDKQLTGILSESLTASSIMTCSRACLTRRRCKSINFNIKTGECQLNSETDDSAVLPLIGHDDFMFTNIINWPESLAGACADHSCPPNSYCHPVGEADHVCKQTGCPRTQTFINDHPSQSQAPKEILPFGTAMPLVCDQGYMSDGDVVCQNNGTWSSPECVSVSSCSMVKQYQPDSEDGEYWLRLTNFKNYLSKIYCYKMSTPSPQEFLSLPYINYGVFPKIKNPKCKQESRQKRGGKIEFFKIKVNINDMKIFQDDKTFAKSSQEEINLRYATAYDCFTNHQSKKLRCGTRGRFTINLRGTGWRVSEDQKWKTFDYRPLIEGIDRQMNGTLIVLKCGGNCGGCRPKGGLFLVPLPQPA